MFNKQTYLLEINLPKNLMSEIRLKLENLGYKSTSTF